MLGKEEVIEIGAFILDDVFSGRVIVVKVINLGYVTQQEPLLK